MKWDAVLHLGTAHHIMPLLYYGLSDFLAELPLEVVNELKRETVAHVLIDENQFRGIHSIIKAFNDDGIDYMFLKGIVLKSMYPHREMRPMGDADILIREEQYEKISNIVKRLGFIEGNRTSYDYAWDKSQVLHLELHRKLFGDENKDLQKYYEKIWDRAEKVSEQCEYRMNDEDFFVYIFTHMAKHYRSSGIGILHILDLWIYLSTKPELDFEKIRLDLSAVGLDIFFDNILHLLRVWMERTESDDVTDFITERIFNSGSYGFAKRREQGAILLATKIEHISWRQARLKKLIWKIFLPIPVMEKKYPILQQYRYLYLVMWFYRVCEVFLFKRDKLKEEARYFSLDEQIKLETMKRELEYVGIYQK